MTIPADTPEQEKQKERGRALPRGRMVLRREDDRGGAAISFLLHLLVLVILIGPFASEIMAPAELTALMGPGPRGGGGGGRQGSGGVPDQIRYIQVVSTPTPIPVPTPPPVIEPPKPVIPPPEPIKPPDPPAEVVKPPEVKVETPPPAAVAASSVVAGVGGGSGNDGTRGDGPGKGGGVGAGNGTGRGNADGPGTGGGDSLGTLKYYPPSPTEIFLPPLPAPNSVHGHHLVATFDVGPDGKVIGDPQFNGTKDKGYNARLKELLKNMRFRPAVTYAGVRIKATYTMYYDF